MLILIFINLLIGLIIFFLEKRILVGMDIKIKELLKNIEYKNEESYSVCKETEIAMVKEDIEMREHENEGLKKQLIEFKNKLK